MPCLIGFRDPNGKGDEALEDALFAAAAAYEDRVQVFTAGERQASNARKAFKIKLRHLPTLVVHDVPGDRKYRMSANKRPSARTAQGFLRAFFAGKLKPLREL